MRFIVTFAARVGCIGMLCAAAASAQAKPAAPTGLFTAATAPDAYSSAILRAPLRRLDEGSQAGTDAPAAIHRNFPQIIEQNFAQLGAARVTALVDSMTDRELHDLAQLYVNASADTSRMQSLLPVLANRLDAGRLARISKHFGYAATYDAVVRVAPAKAFEFTQRSSPAYAAPATGAVIAPPRAVASGMGQSLKSGTGFASPAADIGRFLDMTPNEIYLDFRTAPVGALGPTGALYETANVLAVGVGRAATVGVMVGTVARRLIETYSPELYDAIGGTVAAAVDNIESANGAVSRGHYEEAAGDLFGLSPDVRGAMEGYGGDYGAAEDWYDNVISGGCMSGALRLCAHP